MWAQDHFGKYAGYAQLNAVSRAIRSLSEGTPLPSRIGPNPDKRHRGPDAGNVSTEGLLRIVTATNVSAWTAHALTWAAGVWLTFGPVYEGVSVTPVLRDASETPVLRSDGSGSEATRYTATLIEVNGPYVILGLLVPVVLTGIALLAVQLANNSQARRKILLWGPRCGTPGILCGIDSFHRCVLPASVARASLCGRH